MNSTQCDKAKRNLYSLFILGIFIALVASLGGGLILALGHSRPDVTQPMWKFGQYAMLLGMANLAIYACLFFQMRRLSRTAGE